VRQAGSRRSPFVTVVVLALVVAACSGGPILANPPLTYPSPPTETARPSRPPDPIPVALPRDDGPHDRLTEWWYYTGHLVAEDGRRFGFEAVVFRAERGSVPAAWAAHLALTDESRARFAYAQRSEIGTQVDRSPRGADGEPTGFDLQVGGLNPDLVAAGAPAFGEPWRLEGSDGVDRIEAMLTTEEAAAAGAAFGLRLDLRSTKAPALHDGDGFVDFGPAGSSYYYSRTRLAATGELELDGERLRVEGIAWFDHQWGDFISVGGGWDWFAINLDDGTDITISVVFGPDGQGAAEYGTVVDPGGSVRYLGDQDLTMFATSVWASEKTGRLYPRGWHIEIPGERLVINLVPTVEDQELDARATTGVIYWEGSHTVSATRGEFPSSTTRGGEAYVEMTRYDEP
jgi:predicted secreted hydrolase